MSQVSVRHVTLCPCKVLYNKKCIYANLIYTNQTKPNQTRWPGKYESLEHLYNKYSTVSQIKTIHRHNFYVPQGQGLDSNRGLLVA